jgi:hypothetical protein
VSPKKETPSATLRMLSKAKTMFTADAGTVHLILV